MKADFTYDEDADSFDCPGGQVLPLVREEQRGRRVYQGRREVCQACRYYRRCCRSRSGAARSIMTDRQEALRRAMNEHMSKATNRAVYARRKVIVEPVFGQIKNGGFRGFRVRGKEQVAGEFFAGVCGSQHQENGGSGSQGVIMSRVWESANHRRLRQPKRPNRAEKERVTDAINTPCEVTQRLSPKIINSAEPRMKCRHRHFY